MASSLKKWLILLCAFMLLLPAVVHAQTLEEWNASTMWIIKEETDLYQENNAKKVIGKLEKDDHVVMITSKGDYAVVDARKEDGQIVRGQVLRSKMTTVFSDLQFIFNEDGSLRSLEEVQSGKKTTSKPKVTAQPQPQPEMDDEEASGEVEWTDEELEDPMLSEENAEEAEPTPMTEEPEEDTDEPAEEPAAPEEAEEEPEKEEEPEAPEELEETPAEDTKDGSPETIYVIYAPKNGKATLREKPDKRSSALETCPHHKVVTMLEKGDEYSLISYDGMNGYVLTSALQSHEMPGDAARGGLVLKGKTDGKDYINIRQAAKKASDKIGSFPTGTKLTVIGQKKDWYEIVINGMYGFVQSQYVEMEP